MGSHHLPLRALAVAQAKKSVDASLTGEEIFRFQLDRQPLSIRNTKLAASLSQPPALFISRSWRACSSAALDNPSLKLQWSAEFYQNRGSTSTSNSLTRDAAIEQNKQHCHESMALVTKTPIMRTRLNPNSNSQLGPIAKNNKTHQGLMMILFLPRARHVQSRMRMRAWCLPEDC